MPGKQNPVALAYQQKLATIAERIEQSRRETLRIVNRALVELYRSIGQSIGSGFTFYVCLLLGSVTALAAGLEGVPLNDYTRLGQRFTAAAPLDGLWIIAPSWLDAEGGFTLTLWDSPQRTKRLAQRAFADIPDNARLELWLPKPAPPGTYYWEIDQRTGQTNVGLYVETLESETEDCAFFDGVPDRKRKFSSGPIYQVGLAFQNTAAMLAVLQSDAPLYDRSEACRQLAVVGDKSAVPVLADLLADEQLSSLARQALEAIPDPAAGEALRKALGTLQRKRLVGVINSVGVRQDTLAVRPLIRLLKDPDPEVASAAAVALGRIGTRSAARALEQALGTAPAALQGALCEGLLSCADRLAAGGQIRAAQALFDRLRDPQRPPLVRAAALRGALLIRQPQGLSLLLEQLRSADEAMLRVALWVAQRELPGQEVTQSLAAELDKLPPERQVPLIQALGGRQDPAALPALLALLPHGEKEVRLAVLQALPRIASGVTGAAPNSVVAALIETVGDPDEDLAKAAQSSLESLPASVVEAAAREMLKSAEKGRRLVGIDCIGRRRITNACTLLLQAARDAEPEVRIAALKRLEEQAGPAEIPALLELLVQAPTSDDLDGAEAALAAVCAKTDQPEACTEHLIGLLEPASPPLKMALLRLLHGLGGSQAGRAVRDAVSDSNAEVRDTAIRLLAEWKTADVAADLWALAQTLPRPADRLLCLRGYIRLAGNKELSVEQRLAICQQARDLIQRDEEKKLLLGMLGTIASPEALSLGMLYLEDPATREEAGAALLSIAEALLPGPNASSLREPLQKVARTTADPDLVQRAAALLQQIEGKRER